MMENTKAHSSVKVEILRFTKYLIALAILLFLFKRLTGLIEELKVESISFSLFFFIISCAILISYRTLRISPWLTIYQKTTSKSVSVLSVWIFFQLSELGKYFPGKVGHFVGIVALSRPLGIAKTGAIVSTLLQLIFQCTLGALVGLPALLSPAAREFLRNSLEHFQHNIPLFIGTLAVIVGLCAVFLILFRKQLFTSKTYLQEGMQAIFSIMGTLRLIGTYLLLWVYLGIAFFLFVKSISAIHVTQFPIIMSIYAFAWSFGFMSLVTPGGLGVREGILSVLLTSCLPPATATLVALLSRVWAIGVEIILAGVAWGCYCNRKRISNKRYSSLL